MKLLVLGGTKFLGRHTVDVALARGHEVTTFNRGRTRPDLYPGIEKLHGDREGDLASLAGRSFDAVIDTSGFVPRIVAGTLDALGDVGHYTFVSTISVYADLSTPPTESSPLAFSSLSMARATVSRVARSPRGSYLVMKGRPFLSISRPPSPRTASEIRKFLALGSKRQVG